MLPTLTVAFHRPGASCRAGATALLTAWLATALPSQQVPDLAFEPRVTAPARARGTGPLVGIDEGHNNLHTRSGGFAPLARLLEADGYRVRAVPALTRATLDSLGVLIIANPLHRSNVGNWTLPTPSAFTAEEIALIDAWVSRGGRLWLIADHMPYAGAAAELGSAFGFEYLNGFARSPRQTWPPDRYRKVDGTLLEHPITRSVDSLAGFTGSALRAPPTATPLGRFPATHQLHLPETAWQFTQHNEVRLLEGLTFGAVASHGAGRVAIFTEAAMFTAQLIEGSTKVGFTAPSAPHNQTFVLNVLHWLEGAPEGSMSDGQGLRRPPAATQESSSTRHPEGGTRSTRSPGRRGRSYPPSTPAS